ncbi:MAG: hypothetical protein RL223_3158 [Pseudomonadota bacterium]|jgi:protocatechuate 3,4-dioxygenase beta subunit
MTHRPSDAPSPGARETIDPKRRRGLIGLIGGLGAATLSACGGGGGSGGTALSGTDSSTSAATTSTTDTSALVLDSATEETLKTTLAASTSTATCTVAATETEGPYPLRAILANSAIVRADMTEGKTGVPLTLRLRLVDVNNACAPIAGAWVYIWHCDKDGLYSGYDASNNAGQSGLTYLRAIQQSDANGYVTFKTIFPGWYAGRITHIHAMVFLAGSTLSSTSSSMATTQFAFPQAISSAVYASTLYTHGQNTSVTRFADDNVFSDGTGTEMLTLSGSVARGYVGGIVVGIDQTASNGSGSSDAGAGSTAPGGTTAPGTPGTAPGSGSGTPGTPPGGTPPTGAL